MSPRLWTVPFSDRADLGRLLGRLRDLGLAFVTDPHGWGPAEVFEQLREQRLAHGQYRRADEYPWNLR